MRSTTGFAAGEWSIADAAAAPILIRMMMSFEHDVGKYPEGEGKRIFAILRDYAEFARLRKYIEDLRSRPSFLATYDEVSMLRFAFMITVAEDFV